MSDRRLISEWRRARGAADPAACGSEAWPAQRQANV